MSELHVAARDGSTERTLAAVLPTGGFDMVRATPLMCAALFGQSRLARILLDKGADMSIVNDDGFAALHLAAHEGHLAVIKLVVKAGADLEAKTSTGCTPLYLATQRGHSEVMGVLIEAGANPNSCTLDGATPLYVAAQEGHFAPTKVLLRAKPDPLLAWSRSVPLDAAAYHGHLEVARELIHEYGIEGCGGASGGVTALQVAAQNQHVEIMGMLISVGVVDTGIALRAAVSSGRESSVKFLLQQRKRSSSSGQGAAYLETRADFGGTPLLCSIEACRSCSPRITRLLVEAGADITTAVRITDAQGRVDFDDTPLALVDLYLSGKKIKGKGTTESQLHSLEATQRLLMRVEAFHAVSWLWARAIPSITQTATERTNRATKTTSAPLISMLPILRRRAGRTKVVLAALFSQSRKPY